MKPCVIFEMVLFINQDTLNDFADFLFYDAIMTNCYAI